MLAEAEGAALTNPPTDEEGERAEAAPSSPPRIQATTLFSSLMIAISPDTAALTLHRTPTPESDTLPQTP